MTWRTITEADLLQHISGVELDTFRGVVLGDGQADPIPGYLDAAAKEAASFAAAAGYEVGASGTAPAELIAPCCARVVVQLMARAAGSLIDPDGVRQKASDQALTRFREVQAGKFQLSELLAETMQDEPSNHSGVSHRPRPIIRRENMKGL